MRNTKTDSRFVAVSSRSKTSPPAGVLPTPRTGNCHASLSKPPLSLHLPTPRFLREAAPAEDLPLHDLQQIHPPTSSCFCIASALANVEFRGGSGGARSPMNPQSGDGIGSVAAALAAYFAPEEFEGVNCEGCGGTHDHTKTLGLESLPYFLPLALKRFAMNWCGKAYVSFIFLLLASCGPAYVSFIFLLLASCGPASISVVSCSASALCLLRLVASLYSALRLLLVVPALSRCLLLLVSSSLSPLAPPPAPAPPPSFPPPALVDNLWSANTTHTVSQEHRRAGQAVGLAVCAGPAGSDRVLGAELRAATGARG